MDQREWDWPAVKLAALRLGRRLGVLLPASQPPRWSLVHIVPSSGPADEAARRSGRARSDPARSFRVTHWEFEADRLEGYDPDLGAVRLRHADAADEAELLAVLREWQLRPEDFEHSWDTVDPH
ncbi:hypothetical protein AMIS_9220 [Actinoplanes missouriensis 431]|uniref:Uncharacterized protein n=1 Tax=Actinoplanes missouriensis (strain ATCC 14538 / DSM 43046 / CBS 188.64 / JCM 3121 / NBRC 102363 / NCIMB 12654 / NRRL B-3342 / UNCC 431) TaxID=512565 RepID=I0GZF5_ACTM4|nr:hypothetical protein [Actinoplanes missouriensis]BAL86142.1 hypothetical protein AMIS_9220 [Actinoplanes missouriensis 431]